MKSKDVQNNPGDPQLWCTGGVLQCCHCSLERKKLDQGKKNHDFQFKGAQKQRFFTGSGKVEENLFPTCRRKQYWLGFPPSSRYKDMD